MDTDTGKDRETDRQTPWATLSTDVINFQHQKQLNLKAAHDNTHHQYHNYYYIVQNSGR